MNRLSVVSARIVRRGLPKSEARSLARLALACAAMPHDRIAARAQGSSFRVQAEGGRAWLRSAFWNYGPSFGVHERDVPLRMGIPHPIPGGAS